MAGEAGESIQLNEVIVVAGGRNASVVDSHVCTADSETIEATNPAFHELDIGGMHIVRGVNHLCALMKV